MRKLIFAGIILLGFSCKKNKTTETKPTDIIPRCGTIMMTPILDSFIAPTYYITMLVSFPEGDEIIHCKGDVTGDHDGSWFLSKYNKDSTYCTQPIVK
jgi:hypothetical protein